MPNQPAMPGDTLGDALAVANSLMAESMRQLKRLQDIDPYLSDAGMLSAYGPGYGVAELERDMPARACEGGLA